MKLKIINIYILLLSICISFTSCHEEVDADFYNKTSPDALPTITVASDSISFDRVYLDAQIEINGDSIILESGYMACVDNTFPDSLLIVKTVDHNNLQMSVWFDLLVGNTKYFYKAYTYTKNGFSFSEVSSFITTDPPVFEDTYLFGEFNQIDHSIRNGIINGDDNEYWDAYGTMKISQVEGTYNQIAIYNYWGYGRTVIAVVNFEDKTIEISPQEVAVSAKDGPLLIYRWSMDNGSMNIHLDDTVKGHYDEDGNITILMWGAFANTSEGYLTYEACSETHLVKRNEDDNNESKSLPVKQREVLNYSFDLPIKFR
ncbi:hypothetical protein [Saccharicrinis aurantiacus]|uniref:hypothetical protein n=1 Tax=Saccharicrinis aurantiacus TaxID=1849719 RepID=UPI00094FE714|nr:hypothetical protein [Saccharicrinis aurantiacus]